MPAQFTILPNRNLVVFTYSGRVAFHEVTQVVAAAAAHPAHRSGMRQLCDLTKVTGVEHDYAALMKMQAQLAESMVPTATETLVLFYAPTAIGQEIAQMARRSWEGLDAVIVMVQTREAEALALFGLPENSLAALMVGAN